MQRHPYAHLAIVTLLVFTFLWANAPALHAQNNQGTPAGTKIINRAQGLYQTDQGETIRPASPIVEVSVVAIPAVTVSPDQTTPSGNVAPGETVLRAFQICNSGNNPSRFIVMSAGASEPATLGSFYFDINGDGAVSSVDSEFVPGQALTPGLLPGACVSILAYLHTGTVQVGTLIDSVIQARAEGDPQVRDSGRIIDSVGGGARISSPENRDMPPVKTVDGVEREVAVAGQVVQYAITFKNFGSVDARIVQVEDQLPAGIEYVDNSLSLDGRPLTDRADSDEGSVEGRTVRVRIARVAPEQIVVIRFSARIGTVTVSAISNVASVRADNVPIVKSSPAVVAVDPFGMVYAAHSGGSARIAGANVTLLTGPDPASATVPAPQGQGFVPNTDNTNPFTADALGRYSFGLLPEQTGTELVPAVYYLSVTAPGYRARLIELTLSPAGDRLFNVQAKARDGQPLAEAGGFGLVAGPVLMTSLANIGINVPMLELSSLDITKESDRSTAEVGDLVTYRVTVRNSSVAPLTGLEVSDALPTSFYYVPGTARLTRSGAKPTELEPRPGPDNSLVFEIGELAGGATVVISYRLRIGVGAEGTRTNEARATGQYPSGEKIVTPAAKATVRVGAGIFSERQVVVGRVYVDANGNGQQDRGELGVPGVRLLLNNGQSVITDSKGLYNIPSLLAGAAVISLDPVTLPAGFLLADGNRREGRNWGRLLRTPLGGGGLLRQNFPLVADPNYKAPLVNKPDPKPSTVAGATSKTILEAELRARVLSENQKSGSYTIKASESGMLVEPGEVMILSPNNGEWSMSPALSITALVAQGWNISIEVNGHPVSAKQESERRVDNKHRTVMISFVGVSLKPGPNQVHVTATGPGEGRTAELTVYARGPVTRLEIKPERLEMKAGGADLTAVKVAAFDEWGHPAQDGSVVIETSAGFFNSDAPASTSLDTGLVTPEQSKKTASMARLTTSGGVATVQLRAAPGVGTARLKASVGDLEATSEVRFIPDVRPPVLVGIAEMSFGPGASDMAAPGGNGQARGHFSFFYKGNIGAKNLLTLSYDSARAINRTGLGDRLFELDPNERVYPVFGDSSTRFEEAQSNSKFYVRLDRGRSYAMFGDMDAGLGSVGLMAYSRHLTGAKLHLESNNGNSLTVTGARPDTAFARDVFPAGNPLLYLLNHRDILRGSETVAIEVRDRRNPEVLLTRELLSRSIDYQIDTVTGQLFMMRQISSLDFDFNLVQIVATYEYKADDLSSMVYTGRGLWNFGKRGRLGASFVGQRRDEGRAFSLAGIDGEFKLWRGGRMTFAMAASRGESPFANNVFAGDAKGHDGMAIRITAEQPLGFYRAMLRGSYSKTSPGFLNPYGPTQTPGSERAEASLQLSPGRGSELKFGVTGERNRTERVDNDRITFSALWSRSWSEKLRTKLGFDMRKFDDRVSDRSITSNLLTAAVEFRPTDKLQLALKREQNIGEADPTYPNQTTLQASYLLSAATRIFFSQRLASAAITPISDVALTGFSGTTARHETQIGVETKYGKHTSFNGRYQIENGINGTDSFAVIGLQNRIPLNKKLSLDLQAEHGIHMTGQGGSFTSGGAGFSWTPLDDFKASARYELRRRDGLSHLFTAGAAGRLDGGFTMLGNLQYGRTSLLGRNGRVTNITAAGAYRPVENDRAGLLFSYGRVRIEDADQTGQSWRRFASDTLSADGYLQPARRLQLYSRVAFKLSGDGDQALPYASAMTLMTQARLLYQVGRAWEVGLEQRWLYQLSTGDRRMSSATELGYWLTPDVRVGGGYRFAGREAHWRGAGNDVKRGFYFTISTKISNLFDLFGTSKKGLASNSDVAGHSIKGQQQ